MYRHILIPTDGTRFSRKAVKHGVALARKVGARVTGFIATPTFRYYAIDPMSSDSSPENHERDCRRYAERALAQVAAEAKSRGVACRTVHVVSDQPYKAVVQAATRSRCDLIVMASHGRSGVERLMLGSETAKVLANSRIPVLVCR